MTVKCRLTRAVPVVLIASLGLSACLPLAVVPGALVGAAGLYCAVTSDQGKAMARDAVTGGVPLIACPQQEQEQEPEPEPEPETAPTHEPTPPSS